MPYFFFSSRRRHTRYIGDWSSDVCSSDLFSFLAGFLSEQKSYAMKQQPFSIYCEKFRLVAPHFSPPSLELVPILTPCPNLGQRSNAAKFAPSKLKVELLRRQVERLGHPNSFQDLSSRP